ncbi:hypothetical protein COT97_02775 [Candidatus Falkowbacteria bacterium CG10_big_fil_rev_8_21_14_0_10_39_11]|uniref:Uncharacterized protein n=1 Tax=Candidatus Falkowbacteria bacterium CG10_big_fil_rev_8_21_14_0_10_39_11 TaxID=1974565 RepID=A0A2H0V502_9BACT|nr:MAG: hypothetical protein COT97_02775 [Candidatus Falkowbacteria bacterium CG10_big_fil_rev_8_21_14_0_10_39_11]
MAVTGWILFIVFGLVLILLGIKITTHDYYDAITHPTEHVYNNDTDHPAWFRDVVLWLCCVIVEAIAAGLIWG